MNKSVTILLAALGLIWLAPALAQQSTLPVQTLRGAAAAVTDQAPPERPYLGQLPGGQKPIARTFSTQPPLIPHSIESYQVDLNGNKCLSCHARARTGESQAPMLSITHFMDRDGQFLASVSPRRFFCTQCHVPQHEVKPPVTNDFTDIDTLLSRDHPGGRR